VALEEIAGPVHEDVERRTALHAEHLAAGAHLGPSGAWVRPFHYGDALAEYSAVRERVSIMDVSTLGKLLIVGPDASAFVDHVVPGRVADLEPGRARYVLLLDDAGYVTDDGMLVARRSGGYLLTTTSGGAERTRTRLEHVAYRRADDVHILDLTEVDGAILVAGPRARALLEGLTDDDVSGGGFPHMTERRLVVAGVPCRAIRVGFVGELSFELHHPRDRSVELWQSLRAAGVPFDLVPHGLDALDVLRLEKGHVYIGQDSLPDDTPGKLGFSRMVDLDKGAFVGRAGLVRLLERPSSRALVGLGFSRGSTPDGLAGQPIWRGDEIVGRVTSCEYSPALDSTIGLGWLLGPGSPSVALRAGDVEVRTVATPFLDPDGERVRG
jgi:sarcosine oxidase subunit alpha